MINKIRELIVKYMDMLLYLVFGVLTTLVNYAVYLPCLRILGMPAAAANTISWLVSVAFAFLTNKPFVFKSHDWALETVIPELLKFMGTRIASGLLETGILFVTVDLLGMNGVVWKIVTSVLVVVANYVGSKLLVFRSKE